MRLIYIIVYFKVENNFITLQLSQPMSHVSEDDEEGRGALAET